MKQKRWSKVGKEMKAKNPALFTGGAGKDSRHFVGGAHRNVADYRRSDVRSEERTAKRGTWE